MSKSGQKGNILPRPKTKTSLVIGKQIKLRRTIPENVALEFTDGLTIQQRDEMFFLSFLQTKYPLAVTNEEIQTVKEIEQRCIAQLIVAPSQMARNLFVLNRSLQEFIKVQSPEIQNQLRDLLSGKTEADETDGIK